MKANSTESIKRNIRRRQWCQDWYGMTLVEYEKFMAERRQRRMWARFARCVAECCENSPFGTIRPVLTSRGLELANA